MLIVADRGESGIGWAAIDDFEFLYDVFQVVTILSIVRSASLVPILNGAFLVSIKKSGKMLVWFGSIPGV